jgi:hypothetical protein
LLAKRTLLLESVAMRLPIGMTAPRAIAGQQPSAFGRSIGGFTGGRPSIDNVANGTEITSRGWTARGFGTREPSAWSHQRTTMDAIHGSKRRRVLGLRENRPRPPKSLPIGRAAEGFLVRATVVPET